MQYRHVVVVAISLGLKPSCGLGGARELLVESVWETVHLLLCLLQIQEKASGASASHCPDVSLRGTRRLQEASDGVRIRGLRSPADAGLGLALVVDGRAAARCGARAQSGRGRGDGAAGVGFEGVYQGSSVRAHVPLSACGGSLPPRALLSVPVVEARVIFGARGGTGTAGDA